MSDEMVSVPPNATQAMLDAGYLAIQQGRGAKSVWQVMVAAAPQPAQGGEKNAVPQVIPTDDASALSVTPTQPAGTAPAPASGGETPKEPSVLANIFEWQNYAKALQRELAQANAAREGAMEEAARICETLSTQPGLEQFSFFKAQQAAHLRNGAGRGSERN